MTSERQKHCTIQEVLELASRYGQIDGAHHKAWAIDQMVRLLTVTPERYAKFVAEHCDGEDGPNAYEWDEGIAP